MFKKANILKLKQFKFNIFKFVKNYKILYQNTRLWNNEGCVSENWWMNVSYRVCRNRYEGRC